MIELIKYLLSKKELLEEKRPEEFKSTELPRNYSLDPLQTLQLNNSRINPSIFSYRHRGQIQGLFWAMKDDSEKGFRRIHSDRDIRNYITPENLEMRCEKIKIKFRMTIEPTFEKKVSKVRRTLISRFNNSPLVSSEGLDEKLKFLNFEEIPYRVPTMGICMQSRCGRNRQYKYNLKDYNEYLGQEKEKPSLTEKIDPLIRKLNSLKRLMFPPIPNLLIGKSLEKEREYVSGGALLDLFGPFEKYAQETYNKELARIQKVHENLKLKK